MSHWLNRTHVGDCRALMAQMAADGVKVQTCVTSPPYFGLRDYGHDGQIGLESSPAEYVDAMVDVFRAVREVLADDGTVWLNLGDSYATSAKTQSTPKARGGRFGNSGGEGRVVSETSQITTVRPDGFCSGLPDKNLLGIPWRVAFALQQPYYTGRIKDERDRVWLAAMVDGEGCLFIHRRKAGSDSGAKFTKADGITVSYARTQDTYGPGVEVANTSLGIVERCQSIVGMGSISRQDKDRRQPLYRWSLRGNEARNFVREIYPYLIAKKQQARILCGSPTSGEKAEAAHAALMLLHHGGFTDIDFKEPASMHEPGYYLRQDLIWSKPNPMPESVRDRCTKAHEYVFLLAKSERYYFDAESIAESAVTFGRQGRGEADQPKQKAVAASGFRNDPGLKDDFSRETRNRRSVWTVTTKPFSGAHFATFPPELIQPCILAGAPAGGVVLDPFMGSGTTGQVATDLGRQFIGCELNLAYIELHDMRRTTIGMPL